jgi:hypothetical protein
LEKSISVSLVVVVVVVTAIDVAAIGALPGPENRFRY